MNKLSVKLLLAISLSYIISLIILALLSRLLMDYYINGDSTPLRYNLVTLSMVGLAVLGFVISFLLLIRKKLRYLNHITQKVHVMADDNLETVIEIRGNDELAQLSANINGMSNRLKEKLKNERQLEQTKSELITNVSHDLRTPLTSITGYVDLLRKGKYKSAEQASEYTEIIYSKSMNLMSLINELFEYTRLTSTNIELNESDVDLSAMIRQMCGEYVSIFDKEGLILELNIEESIMMTVDVEKMARVFDNLLENAKKYSIKPSVVNVRLETNHEGVLFSIENKAANLKPSDMERLFERFYRTDKSRYEETSSGLGLAIAKTITELHQGQIDAELEKERLTLFVRLPILRKVKN
ncbi:sensor histidine kinase [Fictibacillus enclensis]|uniref:sensor histidine kinase n=1 Tax=Fictibacillus enclensis TaxID=1017270 RepID=UPI0024C09619|nr:HAMP domain-containing sensor histidine kinase [Fictibacillus enclensis]WHY72819.1 HAMP domain-containing sensor histidine kinase [Fictibacillus enclensis]